MKKIKIILLVIITFFVITSISSCGSSNILNDPYFQDGLRRGMVIGSELAK